MYRGSKKINRHLFSDEQKLLDKKNGNDVSYIENNNFYSSTPNVKKVNGNISDISMNATNGDYTTSKINDSPIRNFAKEQLMNSINANTNGTNTTTIIAEIEGEVKKKSRPTDKTYYIAKEILMTELTYKKDLDVINVVSKIINNKLKKYQFPYCPLVVQRRSR